MDLSPKKGSNPKKWNYLQKMELTPKKQNQIFFRGKNKMQILDKFY